MWTPFWSPRISHPFLVQYTQNSILHNDDIAALTAIAEVGQQTLFQVLRYQVMETRIGWIYVLRAMELVRSPCWYHLIQLLHVFGPTLEAWSLKSSLSWSKIVELTKSPLSTTTHEYYLFLLIATMTHATNGAQVSFSFDFSYLTNWIILCFSFRFYYCPDVASPSTATANQHQTTTTRRQITRERLNKQKAGMGSSNSVICTPRYAVFFAHLLKSTITISKLPRRQRPCNKRAQTTSDVVWALVCIFKMFFIFTNEIFFAF